MWCRFEDAFATHHILASKLKIGNAVVNVELWGGGDPAGLLNNRLLQSIAMSKDIKTRASEQAEKAKLAKPSVEIEAEKESEEVEEETIQEDNSLNPTSYKIIVGSKAVEIDAKEKCTLKLTLVTNVIEMMGFLDPKELETSAYFELTAEIERQMMKFGQINSFKILRKSEGYQNPGKVLVEYQKMEAAIIAKFTINVRSHHPELEIQWKTSQNALL